MKSSKVRTQLMEYMQGRAYRPMTPRELARALDVGPGERRQFTRLVRSLESEGTIIRTRTGRYGLPRSLNLVVGRVSATAGGNAFVDADDGTIGVFVSGSNTGPAMDGDRVLVRIHRPEQEGRRAEGVVLRVLDRRSEPVVGTLHPGLRTGFVVPDRELLHGSVVIATGDEGGATGGDKVVVEITRFPEDGIGPEGRIVEVIGPSGEPGVDIRSVIRRLGLPEQYPRAVQAAAERLPDRVSAEETANRLDLRDQLIVTIDGETAKDFDDAVSLTEKGGVYTLGVHIADVSHYVPVGSALDREAYRRGTSVYLVDRALHMFPARLAEGLASLRAGEDRLAVTALLEITGDGELKSYRFARSVIRVANRLTYASASRAVRGDVDAVPEEVLPLLQQMADLTELLKQRRMRRGCLDFDFPEPVVELDDKGQPIAVHPLERGIADQMIEEFMILTNEAVADFLSEQGGPGVYRIHEPPAEDSVTSLRRTLGLLGLKLTGRPDRPPTFQRLLKRVRGRPDERLVSTLILRAMQKARYAPVNRGHFGLASPAYTQFTSPIRRYPDLMAHRLLLGYVEGSPVEVTEEQEQTLARHCDHCSQRERLAEEAERETVRLKLLEFMAAHIGEEFDGLISGVTGYGLYVQLDNLAEGLVHVSSLTDDFYDYVEDAAALIGRRKKQRYRLGDEVRVWVAGVNRERRELELRLIRD